MTPPRITVLDWHPLGVPLPPGWRLAQEPRVVSSHNRYGVLIEREIEPPVARAVTAERESA